MTTGEGANIEQPRGGCVASALGLIMLLAVSLPFQVLRNAHPGTFWVDEYFSVLLAERPMSYIINITTFDAHPPGYYLLLRLWMLLGKAVGIDGSIFWVRLPSLLGAALLTCLAWWGGRRLAGVGPGTVFAVLVAFASQVSTIGRDARNYAFVVPLIFLCFLIIRRESARRDDVHWLPWCLYGLAASAALWMHLLSSFALFYLGLLWLWKCRGHRLSSPFVLFGGIANGLAALSFVPWLLVLRYQLEYLSTTGLDWMDTPNLHTLWAVFALWFPFGRVGPVSILDYQDVWLAAAVLTLLPMGLFVLARLAIGRSVYTPRALLGIEAGLVAFAYVCTLCLIDAYGIARIWKGDRYTVLVLPLWMLSVCILARESAAAFGRGRVYTGLLLLPWVAATWHGRTYLHTSERLHVDLRAETAVALRQLPPDVPIYMAPSELAGYFDVIFDGRNILPLETIAFPAQRPDRAILLTVESWQNIFSVPDRIATSMTASGHLAETGWLHRAVRRRSDLPMNVYTLDGIQWDRVGQLLEPEFRARMHPRAVAISAPEALSIRDGFGYLELGTDSTPFQWSNKAEVFLRFDRPLAPGNYTVNVRLFRHPYPEPVAPMTFRLPGTSGEWTQEVPEGIHHLQFSLVVSATVGEPVLVVTHSVWQPARVFPGSADKRWLGFLFNEAWIDPADGAD